jgi:hypothetical protein
MNPTFPQRAFNPKFEAVSTEELLKELIDRRQAYVEQLNSVVALFSPARPTVGDTPSRVGATATKQKPSPRSNGSDAKSLSDRILATLSTVGRPLKASEFPPLLVEGGWTTAATDKMKVVSTYLSDLVKKGALKRNGDGTVSLGATRTAMSTPAAKRTKQKKARKSMQGKKKPIEGKRTADYLLRGLAAVGKPSKPGDLLPVVKKAGWTSTSDKPEKVLETALRNLVKAKKVKAHGNSTFEALG